MDSNMDDRSFSYIILDRIWTVFEFSGHRFIKLDKCNQNRLNRVAIKNPYLQDKSGNYITDRVTNLADGGRTYCRVHAYNRIRKMPDIRGIRPPRTAIKKLQTRLGQLIQFHNVSQCRSAVFLEARRTATIPAARYVLFTKPVAVRERY